MIYKHTMGVLNNFSLVYCMKYIQEKVELLQWLPYLSPLIHQTEAVVR